MAYIVNDVELGFVDLSLVDTVGPGPLKLSGSAIAYGRYNQPGIEVRGIDPVLGGGTFLFVQFAGTVSIGTTCELTQTNVSSGTRYDISAQAWAGAVNTGKPLGVSMCAATVGQWGWVQVQGIAIAAVSGAPAAGNPVSWQASGVVSPTVVAGSRCSTRSSSRRSRRRLVRSRSPLRKRWSCSTVRALRVRSPEPNSGPLLFPLGGGPDIPSNSQRTGVMSDFNVDFDKLKTAKIENGDIIPMGSDSEYHAEFTMERVPNFMGTDFTEVPHSEASGSRQHQGDLSSAGAA
jgi:hypothetical protein